MLIEILSVTPETKVGKTGKPYKTLQVAFKNLTFGNKIEGKSLMVIGAQAAAAAALATATPGSRFEVTVTKNASGFNDWTGAVPAAAHAAPAAQPARTFTPGAQSATNPRGFPTEEERAKTQVYIVRQSSITSATAALSIGAKTPPTAEAVIERAKQYEAYVFGQDSTPITPQNEFDDVPDFDIPE